MYTRTQLLENQCTHSQYYSQFLTYAYITNVVRFIGRQKIMESTDSNFNDTPLQMWELIQPPRGTSEKMKECGDYLTKSGVVCIAKEAARNFKINQYSI